MDPPADETANELLSVRNELSSALGERESEYQQLMKSWFSGHITRSQIEFSVRELLRPEQMYLHNQFIISLLKFCSSFTEHLRSSESRELIMPTEVDQFDITEESEITRIADDYQTALMKDQQPEQKTDFTESIDPNLIFGSPTPVSSPDDFLPPASKVSRKIVRNAGPEPRLPGLDSTPQLLLPSDDSLELNFCSSVGYLVNADALAGRVYVALWEQGLTSVTPESVRLLMRGVENCMRNIVRTLVSYKSIEPSNQRGQRSAVYDRVDPSPFSKTNISKTERDLKCDWTRGSSKPPITLRDAIDVLSANKNLIPSSTVRLKNLERSYMQWNHN